jgi:hypothetical protein
MLAQNHQPQYRQYSKYPRLRVQTCGKYLLVKNKQKLPWDHLRAPSLQRSASAFTENCAKTVPKLCQKKFYAGLNPPLVVVILLSST